MEDSGLPPRLDLEDFVPPSPRLPNLHQRKTPLNVLAAMCRNAQMLKTRVSAPGASKVEGAGARFQLDLYCLAIEP